MREPARRPPASRSRAARRRRSIVSGSAVFLFLLAWELAPRFGLVDPFYVSQPSRVLQASGPILSSGDFLEHVMVSLSEFAAGLGLAAAVGVTVGLLLGSSRPLRLLAEPPIMALYSTPNLALLPILVVWLGIGAESKVAVAFLGAVIPIVVSSAAGVRHVDAALVVAARSFGARRLDLFRKVILPGSLPGVMVGLRLGVSRAVLGVVVAEMYVSRAGVGNQIMRYGAAFRVDQLLFYTLLVSAFGFAATALVRMAEERLQH